MPATQDRDTKMRDGVLFSRKMAATKKIFAGTLACLNATGYSTPGATATTLVADGRAEETVDNTNGADGDVSITIRKGVFCFANSTAGDLITIAEIGDNCYIVDDQTVAKTNGTNTRSVAGKIEDVDSAGVWVRVG